MELQEATFLPTYHVATLWSTTYHVNVLTVNPNAAEVNGGRPQHREMQQKSHVLTKSSEAATIGLRSEV